jgi:hypothetical protein
MIKTDDLSIDAFAWIREAWRTKLKEKFPRISDETITMYVETRLPVKGEAEIPVDVLVLALEMSIKQLPPQKEGPVSFMKRTTNPGAGYRSSFD